MMLPRISYLPFVFDKLEKMFSKAADFQPGVDEMWLSFEEQPLKWCVHRPSSLALVLMN